jgi:hypothetical protein
LTLAHWPYVWKDSSRVTADSGSRISLYEAAVRRVDRQFADVMRMLERNGALSNAIVIVFSDHGEALGEPGDAPYASPGSAIPEMAQVPPTGHGTSILSPHQYQTLLAVRSFGTQRSIVPAPHLIDAPVSLIDIAPTVTEALRAPSNSLFDGISLLPLLQGGPAAERRFAGRIRFTETEYNPRGFGIGETPTPEQVKEAVSRYELNAMTGRIQLRRASVAAIVLRDRQYAALRDDLLLAALPDAGAQYRFVVVDSKHDPVARAVPPERLLSPDLAPLLSALLDRFEQLRPHASADSRISAEHPSLAPVRSNDDALAPKAHVVTKVTKNVTF